MLQGITPENHLSAIRRLLSIPEPHTVLISAAFVNEAGLTLVEAALAPVADRTKVLAGIRNGITSAQGLRKSLAIGCSTFAIDTGSRSVIFHPKMYYARNETEARLIVGSANLTVGGLNGNIEASLLLTLDLDNEENVALTDDLEQKINCMISDYEDHVFQVPNEVMIRRLLDSGRLVDETLVAAPMPSGASRDRNLDTVPRIKLRTRLIVLPKVSKLPKTAPAPAPMGGAAPVRERLTLVWQSSPLTRRYLTIPTGQNTNPTGSMLFTKGAMENIDQRHHFRDVVFADLDWSFDTAPGRRHMERASARFQLVIRNVGYGVFTLRLSHNSRTDTRAYAQRNSMTQLHWGDARPLVAREDLLGRRIYLYHDKVESAVFVLEID